MVRDACLSIRRDSDVPYEHQDPKHICDPLIWFEQGRPGAAAAGSDPAREYLEAWKESRGDENGDDVHS